MPSNKDKPSSVTQLAAARAALGLYHGANTPAEHVAEARRLGGDNAYRVRLANALVGAVQTEAILAEAAPISLKARAAAFEPAAHHRRRRGQPGVMPRYGQK